MLHQYKSQGNNVRLIVLPARTEITLSAHEEQELEIYSIR